MEDLCFKTGYSVQPYLQSTEHFKFTRNTLINLSVTSICERIVYDIAKDFTFFQEKYLKNRRHKKNQRCIEIFEKSENDNYQ